MKTPLSDLPFRQKMLWLEVSIDLLLLAAFIVDRVYWPASRNPAAAFLILSCLVPFIYDTLKGHSTDDRRVDERDNAIQGRGRDAGYRLMTVGIAFILIGADGGFPFGTALLVVWLCSRILTHSVQLRLYAGHEAWWPDNLIAALNRRKDQRLASVRERMRP